MAEDTTATPTPGQGRKVMMTHPQTGAQVSRVDYIREQYFDKGRPRGPIAKELGVKFQIVFGATNKEETAKREKDTVKYPPDGWKKSAEQMREKKAPEAPAATN